MLVEAGGRPKNLGCRLNFSSVHPDETLVWVGWFSPICAGGGGGGLLPWVWSGCSEFLLTFNRGSGRGGAFYLWFFFTSLKAGVFLISVSGCFGFHATKRTRCPHFLSRLSTHTDCFGCVSRCMGQSSAQGYTEASSIHPLHYLSLFFLLSRLQIEELPLTLESGGHRLIAPMLCEIPFTSVF